MIFVLVRRHVTLKVRLLQGVDRQSSVVIVDYFLPRVSYAALTVCPSVCLSATLCL